MQGGWVYIVANKPHGVIYTGVTANLAERIAQHRSGSGGSKFAKKYNLTLLVYAEPHPTMLDAVAREKAVRNGRDSGACASFRRATRTGGTSTTLSTPDPNRHSGLRRDDALGTTAPGRASA